MNSKRYKALTEINGEPIRLSQPVEGFVVERPPMSVSKDVYCLMYYSEDCSHNYPVVQRFEFPSPVVGRTLDDLDKWVKHQIASFCEMCFKKHQIKIKQKYHIRGNILNPAKRNKNVDLLEEEADRILRCHSGAN